MKKELFDLEFILKSRLFKSHSHLQMGITVDYIEEIRRGNFFPFEFPQELLDLYQWHNGQSGLYTVSNAELEILDCSVFYPIQDAIDIYKHKSVYFGEGNFPLFGNIDTLHTLIDLSKSSKDYLTIKYYDYEELSPIKKYPSLLSMIRSNLECYKVGAYSPDNDGLVIDNFNLSTPIQKKYGRGCEYWESVF